MIVINQIIYMTFKISPLLSTIFTAIDGTQIADNNCRKPFCANASCNFLAKRLVVQTTYQSVIYGATFHQIVAN